MKEYKIGDKVYVILKKSPSFTDKEKFQMFENPIKAKVLPKWDINNVYTIIAKNYDIRYNPKIVFYKLKDKNGILINKNYFS